MRTLLFVFTLLPWLAVAAALRVEQLRCESLHQPLGIAAVQAHQDSVHGRIRSHWKLKENGRFTLQITVPVNTRATVHVPADKKEAVTATGATFLHTELGRVLFEVGSGEWEFVAQ